MDVTGLTLTGAGVGELTGRTLHVRGVYPGEQARVRLLALSRQHPRGHASLLELLRAHPARRKAPCVNQESRRGRCTGCPLMALDEGAQREAKREMLRTQFGLSVTEIQQAPLQLGYRLSSKRVVFGERGRVRLGSYSQGSHDPARMTGCLVDHPALARVFDRLEQLASELQIAPYDERTGSGELRYVWAKTNGRELIVTLVSAGEGPEVERLIAPLVSACDQEAAALVGVQRSVQASAGNSLRGERSWIAWGRGEVSIELLGERVEVGALGFVQPNPAVAELAYRSLLAPSAALGHSLAFDLYAGAGITTRALGQRFAEVVACEAHPESAAALGIEPELAEAFLTRVLADPQRAKPELVIANPPRKGLGPEVCALLRKLSPPELRIMSCGPEGLARDLGQLAPDYTLDSLEAFDTLPQTAHVELVAKLTRKVERP